MNRQRTSRMQLMTAGALLVLAFAVGPAAAGGPAPSVGATAVATPETTAVIGEAQEPNCLNAYVFSCSLEITQVISGAVLSGAYRVRPDLSYEPVLVEHVDVETGPFTLTYHLEPTAEWSDGVPVTADDLIFTLETILNPANTDINRAGYETIVGATKLGPKTARFVFSGPFPSWKRLFPRVLPRHVLAGHDFNMQLLDSIPVSSGPFMFESWEKGTQLSLVRNENWWGPHLAYLPRVVFRFVLDTNARFQRMKNGEFTLLREQPQLQLLDLPPEIAVEWIHGPSLHHLDVNTASPSMPLLAHSWFRHALAHAIDREVGVDAAFGSLSPVLIPGLDAHDSLLHASQHADYLPHFDDYGYAPATVSQLMQNNGCVMGGDGIWSCGGTRASVRFATTAGNVLRAAVQNSFISSAAAAGIELVPDNSPAPALFGVRLPAGDFDLVMFSWALSGEPSAEGPSEKYACGGDQNHMSYCSNEVDALLDAAAAEANDVARAAMLNEVDEILAEDAPSIPLFQGPVFLAHKPTIVGLVDNMGPQGIVWNIEEWQFPGAPFGVSTAPASNGVVGRPYSFVIEPVGGAPPYSFELAGGTLPPGLTIAPNGTLLGTPTTPGAFAFDVNANQCCGEADAQGSFTVTIREALAITTTGLISATVGVPYAATLGATGAGGLVTGWSISAGSLPAGLTLGAAAAPPNATISGTPTAAGTSAFTVKMSDTDGFLPDRAATRELTLVVAAPIAAAPPTGRSPTGIVGKRYAGASPSVTGGLAPYRWTLAAGVVAPGLSVDSATGKLVGTPTRAGRFAYTLGVADVDARIATVDLDVSVVKALDVVTSRLRPAKARVRYRAKLLSRGGLAPTNWKIARGKLPAGLRLGKITGVLSGKPRAAGTFKFTVTVSDSLRQKSSQVLKLVVRR